MFNCQASYTMVDMQENDGPKDGGKGMGRSDRKKYPEWLDKYRGPGREIRCFGNRYYLYEYRTEYDKVDKKTKKL